MTIYDALGLLAHFLMLLMIFQQEIWPEDTETRECRLEQVYLERAARETAGYVASHKWNRSAYQDASENGFAAAAYLRFEEEGKVKCALIRAKTIVAPLQFVPIPRLELQAT
ncbi:uncharacterized protein LOC129724843 [Wyeomyia smithii]|uniref:uncharacterized protein LOC129724843 n=1 Tax=Wyeomyia smithii TaxID=174621 RepID=UPI0024680B6A|nr:uncharacterized protein LOC129724843 [Wyeomyia smithii]